MKVLAEVREDTQSALDAAAEHMKHYYDKHVWEAPVFQIGDKVWLNTKNLHIKQPSRKFSHKGLGPFKVLQHVGELNYKLKLPKRVPVCPVFHVSLLSKYSSSTIPGRKQPEPPPLEVEGEEEYKVERILDSCFNRQRLEYLVQWKGYDASHNDWEPAVNIKNAAELVAKFHKRHPSAPQIISANFFGVLNFKPIPEPMTVVKGTNWEMGCSFVTRT